MTTPRWLTPERQLQVRNILFGALLFFGLVVWIFHTIAARSALAPELVHRLRVLGVMTWLYALVQLIDMRFYHSRFARRRAETAGVPEHMLAWLLAQALPWYGIVYYALVADVRWYVVGLVLAALTTWAYPVPSGRPGLSDRLRNSRAD
ncbi:MAG: hypothetical protein H0X64_06750 [Gemmatimonadaceae bacterium]|nr:hypothetical protein [Gemmatimonadaceae bacterium]